MARIPDTLVQEILQKTDIVSVIGDYVRLNQKGSRWVGLCPFHNEKSPSFSVDRDKGLFYCFGCHKGGSAVQFLMELDKMTFPEAIEDLAKRCGVPLVVEEGFSEEEKDKKALYELYERLQNTFHWFLTQHPSGAQALERLKTRGLSDDIISTFKLGYAPRDRSWLFNFLTGKGYSADFLARSGLFAGSDRRYPIFADRIMFPIADSKGKTIAFGGRLLQGEGPKYINSPDTALFKKHDNLFALDKALPNLKKEAEALICEGYMDAISFHAAGQGLAVAPLGTAFTPNQARLLKRWCERVLLCFDSDEAGRKAAERSCAIAAAAGLDALVISLPGGKDASEILEKEGPERLQKVKDLAINGGDFLVRRSMELFDIGTVEGKARAAAYWYPYADALGSEVKRYAFMDNASREIGADPLSVRADYETAKRVGQVHGRRETEEAKPGDSRNAGKSSARTDELVYMAAVVLNSQRFSSLRSLFKPEDFDDFRARDIFFALEESFRADDLGVEAVLARIEDDSVRRFIRESSASGVFAVGADKFIDDGTLKMQRSCLGRRRQRIIVKIAGLGRATSPAEIESLNALMYEKQRLDSEWEAMKGERD